MHPEQLPDYAIIEGVDAGDLERKVGRRRAEGYSLVGGASVRSVDGHYVQAMVRNNPQPKGEVRFRERR